MEQSNVNAVMNTEGIDSQKCPPKSVLVCWLVIAVWLGACVVNAVWLHENQGILDGIGFCLLIVCIPLLLMFGIIRRDKNFWTEVSGLYNKVYRGIRIIHLWMRKLYYKLLRKGRNNVVGFCRNTISYVGLFCLLINPDEHWNDVFSCIYGLLWLLFLGGFLLYYGYFLIKIFSVIALFMVLFYFKFIYFAVVRCSGILRRIGINVAIMLLVFVVFKANIFSEWLIDSLVIASLSLFLYDVYRITGIGIFLCKNC